jgi:hypothetical protein
MSSESLENRFLTYLDRHHALDDIQPFLRVYIQLLFLYQNEIPQNVSVALLERQKQLHGQAFQDEGWDDLKKSSREEQSRHLRENSASSREALLNNMLFCAMLDTGETDFYYFVEPVFDFAQGMKLEQMQLQQILESEFKGFKT